MKKNNNFGEKNLTRFFNDELISILRKPMRKLGFPVGKREKQFYRKKFDLYFYSKKKKTIVIVESEIKGWCDYGNLEKLEEIKILKWRWLPNIIFFQIFSPYYSHSKSRKDEKRYCLELAKKIKLKHKNFKYYSLDIKIGYEKFHRMINAFQRHKHQAKQYYGTILRKEIRRLSREIIKIVDKMV